MRQSGKCLGVGRGSGGTAEETELRWPPGSKATMTWKKERGRGVMARELRHLFY